MVLSQSVFKLGWSKKPAVIALALKKGGYNTSMLGAPMLFMGMVSLTGTIVSLSLGTAIWLGTIYMQDRKLRAIDIEETLIRRGGKRIISPRSGTKSPLRKSPTILMLKLVPFVLLTVWLTILIVNITLWLRAK